MRVHNYVPNGYTGYSVTIKIKAMWDWDRVNLPDAHMRFHPEASLGEMMDHYCAITSRNRADLL